RGVERAQRHGLLRWQLCAAVQLENEQSRHVADRPGNLGENPRGECPYTAPTREHRNVLLAFDRVSDGRGDDAGLHAGRPEFRTARCIVSRKFLGGVALEYEAAARRQHAAIPGSLEVHAPTLLLRYGVPGDECALGCRLYRSADVGIG